MQRFQAWTLSMSNNISNYKHDWNEELKNKTETSVKNLANIRVMGVIYNGFLHVDQNSTSFELRNSRPELFYKCFAMKLKRIYWAFTW